MRISLLLCALFLAGCERSLFPDTAEEVMAAQKKLPGEIFYTTGDAYGPYRLVNVVTGSVNRAGAVEPAQNLGEKSHITWPATPGYYYVGYKYIDEFGASFYIVSKMSAELPGRL